MIPASAASFVRICRFAMTIVSGIFWVSATACGTTTGAPGLTKLRDRSRVEMIRVDIRDQDEVRLLRPGKVGLTADRIDNDDRGAVLDLNAGVAEGADDEVPTARGNARRRWHLGMDD